MATQPHDVEASKPASVFETETDPKLEMSVEKNERRAIVEKSLKRKLDLRCSLFVLIYIMSESSSVGSFMFGLKYYQL